MGMGGTVHVTLGGLSDSQASQGLGVIGKPEKLKPCWVGEFLVCDFFVSEWYSSLYLYKNHA